MSFFHSFFSFPIWDPAMFSFFCRTLSSLSPSWTPPEDSFTVEKTRLISLLSWTWPRQGGREKGLSLSRFSYQTIEVDTTSITWGLKEYTQILKYYVIINIDMIVSAFLLFYKLIRFWIYCFINCMHYHSHMLVYLLRYPTIIFWERGAMFW